MNLSIPLHVTEEYLRKGSIRSKIFDPAVATLGAAMARSVTAHAFPGADLFAFPMPAHMTHVVVPGRKDPSTGKEMYTSQHISANKIHSLLQDGVITFKTKGVLRTLTSQHIDTYDIPKPTPLVTAAHVVAVGVSPETVGPSSTTDSPSIEDLAGFELDFEGGLPSTEDFEAYLDNM